MQRTIQNPHMFKERIIIVNRDLLYSRWAYKMTRNSCLTSQTEGFGSNNIENTLSILTASLNEVDNICMWLNEISVIITSKKLTKVKEIIIVDDGSTDGTIEKILTLKESYLIPIKLIQRKRKMGTLNAQIIGARECDTDYVLVMDCDLQHPIEQMIKLIEQLQSQPDIVIGSRYIRGGANKWSPYRGVVSRVATFIAKLLISESRNVKDPLSGYFVIKTELISKLRPYEGMYKPLLYALAMHKNLKKIEVPVSMEVRIEGVSKIVNNPIKLILKYLREVLVFWVKSKKAIQ